MCCAGGEESGLRYVSGVGMDGGLWVWMVGCGLCM